MNVLLLDPDDYLPHPESVSPCDLIVDLARAPRSTYKQWARQRNCSVIGLYDLVQPEDLASLKTLCQLGMGQVIDSFGIDWWDIASLLIMDDLLRLMLVRRLAEKLDSRSVLYASRVNPLIEALRRLGSWEFHNLQSSSGHLFSQRLRHYVSVFARLDTSQLTQVLGDRFDQEHSLRRKFSALPQRGAIGVTLLPSGYINVSRTAAAYASILPDERFLLVCARRASRLKSHSPNIAMASLNSYFTASDSAEIILLRQRWESLKDELVTNANEFLAADALGALSRVSKFIRSGVAIRNAWNRVYELNQIIGCFCADDTAPYTRIPLILAEKRGLATLACHHGALDQFMAVKTPHSHYYLAKSEMERDYLIRVCQVKSESIVLGAPTSKLASVEEVDESSQGSSLVFFTEPFHVSGWRTDEVYRDLLPKLLSLAGSCGLKLVFKLHPFESRKSMRRILKKYLPKASGENIEVTTGPISPKLWQNTKIAMTVQSSVALECAQRGIPVFLCSWLKELYGGYLTQYERYGIGQVLNSSEQIADVPRLLEQKMGHAGTNVTAQQIDVSVFRDLLHGTYRSRH